MSFKAIAAGLMCLAAGAAAIGLAGSRFAAPHTATPEMKPAVEAGLADEAATPSKLAPGALPGQGIAASAQQVAQAQTATQPAPLRQPSLAPAPPPEMPTRVDPSAFERIEPREPLSDMYAPPSRKSRAKPVPGQDDWRMTRLFNPIAPAAGRLEARGHKVALIGIEPLSTDEKCTFNGTNWPCGTVARTAFRSWLRARAVQCKVPSVPLPDEINVECYIGRSDIAEWLVANGWARATADGPYGEVGDKAKQQHAGIYGAPPRRITMIITPQLPAETDSASMETDPLESTPDELSQEPAPGFPPPPIAVTPPTVPQAPLQ